MRVLRFRTTLAHRERGFTLTEMAIVLGIIGTILSAIWVAGSRVSAGNKVQQASAETMQILSGYQSLYVSHPVDTAGRTDVTCEGVNAGFFPANMVSATTTCATGTPSTYPSSPFGTAAGGQDVQVISGGTYNGIIIEFDGLSQGACTSLASAIATAPNIIYANINATTEGAGQPLGSTGWSAATISGLCVAGNGNYVEVMFPAN